MIEITKEDAIAFLHAINLGREAFGMDPVLEIEYDRARPGDQRGCLSYVNLIEPILKHADDVGYGAVLHYSFIIYDEVLSSTLAKAYRREADGAMVEIPDPIKRVTDAFDAQVDGYPDHSIRQAFKDAGILADR